MKVIKDEPEKRMTKWQIIKWVFLEFIEYILLLGMWFCLFALLFIIALEILK